MPREKHLRMVLKEPHREGLTTSDSKGDLYRKVVRAPLRQLLTGASPTGSQSLGHGLTGSR